MDHHDRRVESADDLDKRICRDQGERVSVGDYAYSAY